MAALDSGLTEQAHKRKKKDPRFSGINFISSPFQLVSIVGIKMEI